MTPRRRLAALVIARTFVLSQLAPALAWASEQARSPETGKSRGRSSVTPDPKARVPRLRKAGGRGVVEVTGERTIQLKGGVAEAPRGLVGCLGDEWASMELR